MVGAVDPGRIRLISRSRLKIGFEPRELALHCGRFATDFCDPIQTWCVLYFGCGKSSGGQVRVVDGCYRNEEFREVGAAHREGLIPAAARHLRAKKVKENGT
jgi:hypothetical protein